MSANTKNVPRNVPLKNSAKIFFSSSTITDTWSNTILPNIHEEFRLLPDSLLIGSAILALVTQSFSMVIFFATLLETAGLNAALQMLFGFLDKNRLLPTLASVDAKCKSGSDQCMEWSNCRQLPPYQVTQLDHCQESFEP